MSAPPEWLAALGPVYQETARAWQKTAKKLNKEIAQAREALPLADLRVITYTRDEVGYRQLYNWTTGEPCGAEHNVVFPCPPACDE